MLNSAINNGALLRNACLTSVCLFIRFLFFRRRAPGFLCHRFKAIFAAQSRHGFEQFLWGGTESPGSTTRSQKHHEQSSQHGPEARARHQELDYVQSSIGLELRALGHPEESEQPEKERHDQNHIRATLATSHIFSIGYGHVYCSCFCGAYELPTLPADRFFFTLASVPRPPS